MRNRFLKNIDSVVLRDGITAGLKVIDEYENDKNDRTDEIKYIKNIIKLASDELEIRVKKWKEMVKQGI
jgi:hypothetical protein